MLYVNLALYLLTASSLLSVRWPEQRRKPSDPLP